MLDSLMTAWKIKTCVAGGIGCLTFLMGPVHAFTIALCVLIGIDFVTGLWRAIKNEDFSSQGLCHGVKKLLTYGILLIVAHQLSLIGFLCWVKEAMVGYLALTEYESIAENLDDAADIKIPSIKNLKDVFKNMKAQ